MAITHTTIARLTALILGILVLPAPAAEQLLVRDTFSLTAPNPNTTDVNFQLSTRQTGSLAPTTYTKGDEAVFTQIGNVPNALLLAGRSGGGPGDLSLDHDFSTSPGKGNAFTIEFDVNPVMSGENVNAIAASRRTVCSEPAHLQGVHPPNSPIFSKHFIRKSTS